MPSRPIQTSRHPTIAVSVHPPARNPIPEPPRRTPPPMAPVKAIHAGISHDVHPAHGLPGHPPAMLRPSEIDRVLSAARRRAASAVPGRPHAAQSVISRPLSSGATRGSSTPAKSGARATQSLSTASGTGINPWWRYAEENVPGVGRTMVNVGTGNLVLQDDDMSVPHKGIALAFRRTYNSQSQHDVAGTDGSIASMYGNGWTNTFDAHISGSSTGPISVWDIDGARYDYTLASDGVTRIPPPGQYATLTYDGTGCGYLWTKKSGTTYYFWTPDGAGLCPSWWYPSYGAYAGRLYQIIGRNRNTFITFNYSWDSGNSAVGGKISQITAQTESGLTATLAFADVSGHRLLQQLIFPDGATSVNYYYYANGDLGDITSPPNNAAGTRPDHSLGYQTLGTGTVLFWASSPRWCASACGTDGAWTRFDFVGADRPSSALSGIGHAAVVNPAIPDGSNQTVLQPGYTTAATGYLGEYFTTGVSAPTFRDTDGHAINWVVDSLGRPTQTQECTATTNGSCTGTWLVSNETWDSVNNLASEVDPRGNETDYMYDPAGNTIAIGEPVTATSQGTFRPTKIYDYDAFNNVVGFCSESESHAKGADWVGPYGTVLANDSLCATFGASVPHYHAAFIYPSYQPYGQLQSMTTPLGYTRTLSYSASQQGGNDYGLPTSVTGTPFTQINGTPRTPAQTLWYDVTGNLRCYSKGNGTSVLSYDALGRLTSVADPDDSSASATSLCAKSSGQPGWNTQVTKTYFPDGSLQSSQTPAERAGGVATSFTYDVDGNTTTETRHYACTSASACTAGVTTKWYDGADRLVEVALPHDPSDYYSSAWLTRYLYDLTAGGSVSLGGVGFHAYGNLFKTQEWVPVPGTTSPTWLDLRGSAFDALDRTVAKYSFSPSSSTTVRATTMAYDATAATLGLLASMTDPLGEATSYSYDAVGRTTGMQFSGDGGVTPAKSFAYDADGRETSETGTMYGTETSRYDGDGRLVEVDEPTSGSITSPARLTYDYYPDGTRQDVNVASTALNASPLMSYAYRADGNRSMVHVGFGQQQGNFVTSSTDAGRVLSRSDPFSGTAMPSPQTPVAAGSVYGATTWAYDTAGQLTNLQLPQTFAYQLITHDDEGQVQSWVGSYSANGNGPVSMALRNTVRGENVWQGVLNSTLPSYDATIANGGVVARQRFMPAHGGPPTTGLATSVDPVNAIVASTSKDFYVRASDPDAPGWVNCGSRTTTNDYDAASRFVSTTIRMSGNPQSPDCADVYDPTPITTPLHSYDAENHHIEMNGNAPSIQWSPSGRAYKFSALNASVHYDGAQILFITDQNAALSQVKVETMADIAGSGQLSVLDRGFGNEYVSTHDNRYYGGIWLGTTLYGNKDTPPTSIPYLFPGSTTDPTCRTTSQGTSCDVAASLEYARPEGFQYGKLTLQGARALDTSSGQWTTPDAYAGDVHDPMSQKAFMWDRNNPYEYADPTGFAPQQMAICECHSGGYYTYTEADVAAFYAGKKKSPHEDEPKPGQKREIDEGEHPGPKDPGWVTNEAAGEILGWGSGQDSVAALHKKTLAVDHAMTAAMQAKGLPEWKVKHLYNQLVRAYNIGDAKFRNTTLLPRMEYLQRILENWPGTKL
jgi:YD repeat-containing protein